MIIYLLRRYIVAKAEDESSAGTSYLSRYAAECEVIYNEKDNYVYADLAAAAGFAACSSSKGGNKMPEETANTTAGITAAASDGEFYAGTTAEETDYAGLAEKLSKQMANGDFTETCGLFYRHCGCSARARKTLKAGWDQTVSQVGSYVLIWNQQSLKRTVILSSTLYSSMKTAGSNYVHLQCEGKIDGLWTNHYTIPTGAESTDSYTETEIKIGEYELDGILTLPNGIEKPPLVILIQGSGQSDMNETIGAAKNAPFKDLAHGLAEQGIASIRYNKRYYQFPDKATADLTVEDEVLGDAAAAVAYAKDSRNADESGIIILGHSLGAMLAPKIAQDNPDVAGIISLAAVPATLPILFTTRTPQL